MFVLRKENYESQKQSILLNNYNMPVLKGISSVVTPDLLKVLAEMGHSDKIGNLEEFHTNLLVIADANFPAASIASHCPGGLIRLDGRKYEGY